MRFEKDYVITYRSEKGGYPCTVLVNAYNKAEAKEKVRENYINNYREHCSPEWYPNVKWDKVYETAKNLIMHFGIANNTIIDIRD